jgi:hypothetical protein
MLITDVSLLLLLLPLMMKERFIALERAGCAH